VKIELLLPEPPTPETKVPVPLNVSALPVVSALLLDAYTTPLAVKDVRFVPPFAVANVPATDTAPLVAVDGVSPVDPKLIVVTPPTAIDPGVYVPSAFPIGTCPAVGLTTVPVPPDVVGRGERM
jgi:hypothetical protein